MDFENDEVFPTLPLDLAIEILSRLPVKSLWKFRCVSKSWLTLISSTYFSKTHLKFSADNKDYTHHNLVLTRKRKPPDIGDRVIPPDIGDRVILTDCSVTSFLNGSVVINEYNPDYNPVENVSFVGSVNGLICVTVGETHMCIWNPSIRKRKEFPKSRPFEEICLYGFGYDKYQDDYKVVYIFRSESSGQVEVHLFSLKTDSWKSIDGCPRGAQLGVSTKFANGKLYWIASALNTLNESWHIFSFELANEKWGKVEKPPYKEEEHAFRSLGVLGSDLFVYSHFYYPRTYADVWVMKEDGVGTSWTKMYTLKLPAFPDNVFLYNHVYPTLWMSSKGEILILSGSIFMIYNPEDESIRDKRVSKFRSNVTANIYIESLVCPILPNEPSTHQE